MESIAQKVLTIFLILSVALLIWVVVAKADVVDTEKLATAIYYAEGGARTSHPYGILAHYKTTTPRQACINTINNQIKRHAKHICGKDFLTCLRDRYCPIGCDNDVGTNKFWLVNVKYFLRRMG